MSLIEKYIYAFRQYLSKRTKPQWLLTTFCFLLFLIVAKLFSLQILQGDHYSSVLLDQHYSQSTLDAKRGNVFVIDRSQKKMQLTQNIMVYNLFVDPNFLPDKQRFIQDFWPLLYEHFCVLNGMKTPTAIECIRNIESFIGQALLPDRSVKFYGSEQISGYVGSGVTQYELDQEHEEKVQEIITNFTKEKAMQLMTASLDEKIYIGIKKRNYLWTVTDSSVISLFTWSQWEFLSLENGNTVYINPALIKNTTKTKELLATTAQKYGLDRTSYQIQRACTPQKLNYVKLATWLHGSLAGRMKKLKEVWLWVDAKGREKTLSMVQKDSNGKEKKIALPLYHGVGFEESHQRYYPYGNFMSHLIGYLDEQGKGHYGVEEFFQQQLAGKAGKIIGLSSSKIGQIWSNDIDVEDAKNGNDIVLTIDPVIQKEVEAMAQKATTEFNADGIAVTIIDPYTAKIKAMVSTPTFNPNEFKKVLKIKPVTTAEAWYVDNDDRLEYPIFSMSGNNLLPVTTSQRKDPSIQKFMFSNGFWFLSYLNRNIAFPYEPGSIFKPITLW
jgi:cell division protein FtsI/penicillin-binding protein 2